MDSEKPIAFPLPSASQRAIYLPWLKVPVALRYVLTFPWAPEAWQEVRQGIPWLLAARRMLPRTLNQQTNLHYQEAYE